MPQTAFTLLGLCLIIAGTGCVERSQTELPQIHLQRLRANECGAIGQLYYRLRYGTDKLGCNPHVHLVLINRLGPDCFMSASAYDDNAWYAFTNLNGEWIAIGGDSRSLRRSYDRTYNRLDFRPCGERSCNCRGTTLDSVPLSAWALSDTVIVEKHFTGFLSTAAGHHRDVELIIKERLPVSDIDGIEKWKPPGQLPAWTQARP